MYKPLADKILFVLRSFHNKILTQSLALLGKSRKAVDPEKEEIKLDFIKEDILTQSIQIILDISLNEFTINYISSSKVILDKAYTKLEKKVLSEIQSFFKALNKELHDPFYFAVIS
jgi:hypothetical protein